MRSENANRQAQGMRVKSSIKVGWYGPQHNQTVARENKSLRVKSGIKAGDGCQSGYGPMGLCNNHNQTMSKGLRVKSNVKAGINDSQHNQTLALDRKGLRVKSHIKAGMAEPIKDWIDASNR